MSQKVTIIGNLGNDPESRFTPAGKEVCNFSVATNRKYTDPVSQQKVKETTWFRISAWGDQATNCNKYLKKGDKVCVEGRLVPGKDGGPRVWSGSDNVPRASFEVYANSVEFLSDKEDHQLEDDAPANRPNDDIPF
ncbi:MAG: single-stranded DNA-binding protein [Anaerolineae bacterium]|nr:single-stranded DNA-binding protein [Anaerolineae bacterium]